MYVCHFEKECAVKKKKKNKNKEKKITRLSHKIKKI